MDHEQAVAAGASERYALGEMSTPEAQVFEEHYFGCSLCAQDLQLLAIVRDNANAVFLDPPPVIKPIIERAPVLVRAPVAERAVLVDKKRSWFQWSNVIPALCAAAFAAVIVYQNVEVIPDLQAPRSLSAPLILDGTTRSTGSGLHKTDPLYLAVAIKEPPSGEPVSIELDDASGKVVRNGSIASAAAKSPLTVYFPGRLPEGRYTLIARYPSSGNMVELTRDQFDIIP